MLAARADASSAAPEDGLTSAQARQALAEVGPNRLEAARPVPAWVQLLEQFRNPLVAMLLGAAVVAAIVGDATEAAVIGVIVVLNAALGFVQERRAQQSLDALRRMLVTRARVRRDGAVDLVDSEELVPGDLVLVDAGDRVPADGRWVVAHELAVDEASLTGESEPVGKRTGDEGAMNTVATRGRGEMVVTATGMRTRIGQVAELLRTTEAEPTPLQRQLDALARRIVVLAVGAVALVFAIGLARGGELGDEALNAVALAAGAIPEGLPAVVTVTLALGTRHLARRGAIVKRLASVETLGATTVVCTDKTGTLTVNAMTVRAIVVDGAELTVAGEGYAPEGEIAREGGGALPAGLRELVIGGALCNDSRFTDEGPVGDPMEAALLTLAAKAGVDVERQRERLPRISELPFDSGRKWMATFHEDGDRVRVYVKGAPDVLAELCELDEAAAVALAADVERLGARGLRTLAVATSSRAELDATEGRAPEDALGDLRLLGVVGLIDPPRPEARRAIATCRHAGIAVKMITGDHAVTARAIAKDLGIEGDVLTGAELDVLNDDELRERVEHVGVFARVSPEHKVRLVDAFRARGEVVAMTGDGVNDAPALERADIGVAMGETGTEVAKEAAPIVLTDDDFATIVAAVHRGRAIYDDIVKFVRFQVTTNLAAIAVLLTAALSGVARPFDAIHLLWVNLVTDGPPGVALGVDPPAPDVMERGPRRPGSAILSTRRLGVVGLGAAVMTAGTLAVFWWAGTGTERGQTLAFTTFVLFQVVNALAVRIEGASLFSRHTLSNVRLWVALGLVVGFQVVAVQVPALHDVFRTTALRPVDWLVAVGTALTVAVIEELRVRWVVRRRSSGEPATR